MSDMPKPRPPYLQKHVTRHGKIIWYVRIGRGKGSRTRIEGAYGSPEFVAAYQAAVAGEAPKKPRQAAGGTLAWLIARYRDSAAWAALSAATRRQRDNIFLHIIKKSGERSCEAIQRNDIVATMDAKRATPFAARNALEALRGVFSWAADAGLTEKDPTAGIKVVKPRTEGFHAWTEDEIARFERRWPLGTRERLAFDILLYTGLRRGDAVRLGRPHVSDGGFRLRTEKTGIEIVAPILPALAASIAAGPTGDLTFIAGERGLPRTKEGFGNWFREVCKVAGVPGSAHGLRKAGATRAANNGATVAELEAIYGWTGGGMASLYTRKADRVRLAKQAMQKLAPTESGTSMPKPETPTPKPKKLSR